MKGDLSHTEYGCWKINYQLPAHNINAPGLYSMMERDNEEDFPILSLANGHPRFEKRIALWQYHERRQPTEPAGANLKLMLWAIDITWERRTTTTRDTKLVQNVFFEEKCQGR